MSRWYVYVYSNREIKFGRRTSANTYSFLGDLSNWGWEDKEADMGATTRPLGVEVYKLTDSKVLEGWKQPECPKYTGMHGLRMPPRDQSDGYVGL